MWSIGHKPGVGRYCCISCNKWSVRLNDATDALPPCGRCGRGQRVTYTRC